MNEHASYHQNFNSQALPTIAPNTEQEIKKGVSEKPHAGKEGSHTITQQAAPPVPAKPSFIGMAHLKKASENFYANKQSSPIHNHQIQPAPKTNASKSTQETKASTPPPFQAKLQTTPSTHMPTPPLLPASSKKTLTKDLRVVSYHLMDSEQTNNVFAELKKNNPTIDQNKLLSQAYDTSSHLLVMGQTTYKVFQLDNGHFVLGTKAKTSEKLKKVAHFVTQTLAAKLQKKNDNPDAGKTRSVSNPPSTTSSPFNSTEKPARPLRPAPSKPPSATTRPTLRTLPGTLPSGISKSEMIASSMIITPLPPSSDIKKAFDLFETHSNGKFKPASEEKLMNFLIQYDKATPEERKQLSPTAHHLANIIKGQFKEFADPKKFIGDYIKGRLQLTDKVNNKKALQSVFDEALNLARKANMSKEDMKSVLEPFQTDMLINNISLNATQLSVLDPIAPKILDMSSSKKLNTPNILHGNVQQVAEDLNKQCGVLMLNMANAHQTLQSDPEKKGEYEKKITVFAEQLGHAIHNNITKHTSEQATQSAIKDTIELAKQLKKDGNLFALFWIVNILTQSEILRRTQDPSTLQEIKALSTIIDPSGNSKNLRALMDTSPIMLPIHTISGQKLFINENPSLIENQENGQKEVAINKFSMLENNIDGKIRNSNTKIEKKYPELQNKEIKMSTNIVDIINNTEIPPEPPPTPLKSTLQAKPEEDSVNLFDEMLVASNNMIEELNNITDLEPNPVNFKPAFIAIEKDEKGDFKPASETKILAFLFEYNTLSSTQKQRLDPSLHQLHDVFVGQCRRFSKPQLFLEKYIEGALQKEPNIHSEKFQKLMEGAFHIAAQSGLKREQFELVIGKFQVFLSEDVTERDLAGIFPDAKLSSLNQTNIKEMVTTTDSLILNKDNFLHGKIDQIAEDMTHLMGTCLSNLYQNGEVIVLKDEGRYQKEFTTIVSQFERAIITNIIQATNPIEAIQDTVALAKKLQEIGNVGLLQALVSKLETSSHIQQIIKTCPLPSTTQQEMQALLMLRMHNERGYRSLFKEHPKAIPSMHLMIKDLTMLDNVKTTSNGEIILSSSHQAQKIETEIKNKNSKMMNDSPSKLMTNIQILLNKVPEIIVNNPDPKNDPWTSDTLNNKKEAALNKQLDALLDSQISKDQRTALSLIKPLLSGEKLIFKNEKLASQKREDPTSNLGVGTSRESQTTAFKFFQDLNTLRDSSKASLLLLQLGELEAKSQSKSNTWLSHVISNNPKVKKEYDQLIQWKNEQQTQNIHFLTKMAKQLNATNSKLALNENGSLGIVGRKSTEDSSKVGTSQASKKAALAFLQQIKKLGLAGHLEELQPVFNILRKNPWFQKVMEHFPEVKEQFTKAQNNWWQDM